MVIRGVDGCRAGWLCVSIGPGAPGASAEVFPDAESLLRDAAGTVTAIDIPIALPTSRPRSCDEEARSLLGPRRSSVFPAPMRATLEADSYEAACSLNRARCGKKISKQTFAILPKIREINAAVRSSPALAQAAWEVHPEVSFCLWNGRTPMAHYKGSGFGFVERYALVQSVFGDVARAIRESFPKKAVADDDILDALAALWSARRIHEGSAISLPAHDERDQDGLPMQILA